MQKVLLDIQALIQSSAWPSLFKLGQGILTNLLPLIETFCLDAER